MDLEQIEVLERELQEARNQIELLNLKIENQSKEYEQLEESHENQNRILKALNRFSIELANMPAEDIFPSIINKSQELFHVKGAFINSFDELNNELVLEYSSLSQEENSSLSKLLGRKFQKYRTYVSTEDYTRITNETIKLYDSSHELTFGAIPKILSNALENMFDVGWYLGISLVYLDKLVGTIIVIGHKNQVLPNNDEIEYLLVLPPMLWDV